jgi:hypothetical protein
LKFLTEIWPVVRGPSILMYERVLVGNWDISADLQVMGSCKMFR